MGEKVKAALREHEMWHPVGHPLRPDYWECVGCKHRAVDADARLTHRAEKLIETFNGSHA